MTATTMDAGRIIWQCQIGTRHQAHHWVDCCQETSRAIENIWADPVPREVQISEWPYHTFVMTNNEGRRRLCQRNMANGATNRLRRITVTQITTEEHFILM